jgi:PAT family beta-lactamase induction signal transducer AmpG
MGWQAFYLSTLVMGIPGLVLLARFVPPGTREPRFELSEVASQRAVASAASPSELAIWGVGFGILAGAAGSLIVALMAALDAMRQKRDSAFDFSAAWATQWQPASIGDWLQLVSIVAFAAASGLVAVAALAARRRNAPLTSPSEVLQHRAGRSSI